MNNNLFDTQTEKQSIRVEISKDILNRLHKEGREEYKEEIAKLRAEALEEEEIERILETSISLLDFSLNNLNKRKHQHLGDIDDITITKYKMVDDQHIILMEGVYYKEILPKQEISQYLEKLLVEAYRTNVKFCTLGALKKRERQRQREARNENKQ